MEWKRLFVLTLFMTLWGRTALPQEIPKPMTLEESIRIALDRNLNLHSVKEGVLGAEFTRKSARGAFFPKWTGQYGWTWLSSPTTLGSQSVPIAPRDVGPTAAASTTTVTVPTTSRYTYNLSTSLNQPIYLGGATHANYNIAKLGVELSKMTVEQAKLDIVLQTRVGYLTILRAEKFVDVAKQAVKQFEGQLQISQAYFEVGLIAKADVLQAEVNLAHALQAQVKAENDLYVAKAAFNNLLRRDLNTPIEVVDILLYKRFPLSYDESVDEALRQRPELKAAGLSINQAKENVKLTRSAMLPNVSLFGSYFRNSDQVFLNGDLSSDRWSITALATLTLWDWGSIYYQVGASKVKVTQAEDSRTQLKESITLEVKDDYLNMLVAEKNINTASKAIEQAEENLRLNEERYKYQVSTAFDVINAVTLLAQARTNYYGALSDFNVAKASLERSMGRL
jgi:outer membrane protein